ncbi:MAG: hypothetical protein KME29_21955 [Calothrix sp. FI2-JRJ7]|jgi:outer membrane receptor protein involved in Fe transport|nr:hypothetical protein [Calothrix sp. FI2-JRJ7]
MKLDKLFQNLLLLGVVAFASTPAKSEEVQESVQNKITTKTQHKSTLNSTGAVTGNSSPIKKSSSRKPRLFVSQVPSSQQAAKSSDEIQTGGLKGLGFGVGAFYVGSREAQLPNTFEIPSYVRADAALFYRRDN